MFIQDDILNTHKKAFAGEQYIVKWEAGDLTVNYAVDETLEETKVRYKQHGVSLP